MRPQFLHNATVSIGAYSLSYTSYKNFIWNTHAVGFPRFRSRHRKPDTFRQVLCLCSGGYRHTGNAGYGSPGNYGCRRGPWYQVAGCLFGRIFENPKNLQGSLGCLDMLQRRLGRKRKGSANRNKARVRVARLQEHIANCRRDNLHKITHDSQVRTICMEDLNVKGMVRNHHLAQAVGDASFGMLLTMLEYKCRWYGVNLVKIDRFAPSSKTCGQCGYLYKGLKLSERSWTCPECGTRHDRDFNAARNIKEFGLIALPTERGKVKPVDCSLSVSRRGETVDSEMCPMVHTSGRTAPWW